MLRSQRALFNLDREVAYFNGAYMSPQLKAVEEAGITGLKQKTKPYSIRVDDFFEPVKALKASYAQLINANEPDRIALIPSVSYGVAQVAQNVKAVKGGNIVLMEEQFPSNYYTWENLSKKLNLSIRIAKAPGHFPRGKDWNEEVINQIDGQTVLVAMPHVHWADGTLYDLERISQKAKSVNALLIIDGTQSVGALPFDVQKIKPDALICAGYKWLMGPYSTGFAYFGDYFDSGQPIEHNWINRANSEDFRNLVNYQRNFKPLASRYGVGEQSNFIMVPMLRAAIKQLLEWQPENIQDYCKQLLAKPIQHLSEKGVLIEPSTQRAHHLVGLRLPANIELEKLKKALADNHVHLSFRGNAIRLSCHLYNDEQDVERLMRAFNQVA